jgi:murein hydrolase activator
MSQRVSRTARMGAGSVALVAAFGAAFGALADSAAPGPSSAADQERADREIELRGVEDTIRASEDQRQQIESEIEALHADRARLSAALIETTAKVQEAERGAAAADDRLTSLDAAADNLSRSLERRRATIADVLAALQRLGSDPPPAILVKPHDMSEAVRAATVLGAVIPELKSEIEAARQDLDALAKTKEAIVRERDELAQRRTALALDKTRLAALIDARQKSLASAQDALGSQRQRAADLAKQVTSLKDLIARLDSENAARKAAALAVHAADAAAAAEIEARAVTAPRGGPARLRPQTAFVDAKGRVEMPAAGTILKGFGSHDGFGGTERGVSLATPAGATVSAPADGAILFSGPYRTYGQLLIIDAGGGYYVLLAGMDRLDVGSGEFVLTGEPVGVMGDGSSRTATAASVGAVRPVLYIELRKDGTAIDPGPWWVKSDIEKARG